MDYEPDVMRAAHRSPRSAHDVTVESNGGDRATPKRDARVVCNREQLQQAGGDPGRATPISNDRYRDGFRHKGGKYDTSAVSHTGARCCQLQEGCPCQSLLVPIVARSYA
jgi:hypothetical protein